MTSLSLAAIATHIGADIKGNESLLVDGIATLKAAGGSQLSFLANPQYARFLQQTKAAAVILAPEFVEQCVTNVLVMDNPYLGYAKASQMFAPDVFGKVGIASSAIISPTAVLGENVTIGPHVVIEEGVVVGSNSVIGAGCYIGFRSQLGKEVFLHPSVTICHGVILGDRVRVHSGAVLGSDGFGFAPDQGKWIKIEQLGGVHIGDGVEIGANTTIDRGALDDTVIEANVCLDNQIQIGHNVRIGEGTVIAACTGVSGSSTIGRHCMLGGGVGIAGHLSIADGVQITGMTLVTHDIKEAGVYSSGTAVEPNRNWRKNVARFRQLDSLARRIKKLEKSANVKG
jgi:UDP-3-O-[3-hydroxymyristoyl] glucosamine N-acyltransferase